MSFSEVYGECERCLRGCAEGFDRERQHAYRCPIVPSARRGWKDPGSVPYVHMGGEPTDDNPEPPEDNDDGCPGGWYRTRWFASVSKYLRPTANGVYSPNLLLDRCSDRLVFDAVAYYEQQKARATRYDMELISRGRKG